MNSAFAAEASVANLTLDAEPPIEAYSSLGLPSHRSGAHTCHTGRQLLSRTATLNPKAPLCDRLSEVTAAQSTASPPSIGFTPMTLKWRG